MNETWILGESFVRSLTIYLQIEVISLLNKVGVASLRCTPLYLFLVILLGFKVEQEELPKVVCFVG